MVFTIHNLNYGQKRIASAAAYCQKFTTVSPTYAFEIGGNPIIAPHVAKFMGIRNGIDWEIWSPEENAYLPQPYNHTTCEAGKARAREVRGCVGVGVGVWKGGVERGGCGCGCG